jgi:murein L,D-transpeptidase YcbB/YkuD
MRVQTPEELAAIIMKRDQGWSEGRTFSALETGYDQQVALKQRIPVHVTYFTLKVNPDGSLLTYGDLYGHDARMAAALRL